MAEEKSTVEKDTAEQPKKERKSKKFDEDFWKAIKLPLGVTG